MLISKWRMFHKAGATAEEVHLLVPAIQMSLATHPIWIELDGQRLLEKDRPSGNPNPKPYRALKGTTIL